jgi:hypothetical protein
LDGLPRLVDRGDVVVEPVHEIAVVEAEGFCQYAVATTQMDDKSAPDA